ncbi:sortase [bacterium]|nr:sortase [bacterium]
MQIRNWRLFLKIFFFVFVILFFIFNGEAFVSIAKYKIKICVRAIISEIKRPPNFSLSEKLKSEKFSFNSSSENHIRTSFPDFSVQRETTVSENTYLKKTILEQYGTDGKNKIILPKFGIVAPIRQVDTPQLSLIYKELRRGVVLYPGTAEPGKGYSIIIGHSSQYPWEPGRYKSVFSLLNELKEGDKIYVIWKKKVLLWEVQGKKIFLPWPRGQATTESIFPPEDKPLLILQSCWPVGVARKRVAVKTILIDY